MEAMETQCGTRDKSVLVTVPFRLDWSLKGGGVCDACVYGFEECGMSSIWCGVSVNL